MSDDKPESTGEGELLSAIPDDIDPKDALRAFMEKDLEKVKEKLESDDEQNSN